MPAVRWSAFTLRTAFVLFAVGVCSTAPAVDRTWNSTSGGSFTDSSKWTGGVVPGAADNAIFSGSGLPFTVTVPTVTTKQLTVDHWFETTLSISGTYTVTDTTNGVRVGTSAASVAGFANISSGTLAAGTLRVGDGRAGVMLVSGYASLVENSLGSPFIVGNTSSGTLTITDYGDLNADQLNIGNQSAGEGTFNVQSNGYADVSLINIGLNGDGAVNVSAQLDTVLLYLGGSSGSSGALTVSDGGVANVNGYLVAGSSSYAIGTSNAGGTATIDILNGGVVNVDGASGGFSFVLGAQQLSTATATVDGATSELNVTNDAGILLGSGTGSTGRLTVSNGGSVSNNGNLGLTFVGGGGADGQLLIESGGLLDQNRQGYVLSTGANLGVTVTDAGSEWNVDDQIIVGDTSGAGLLKVLNGGHVMSNSQYSPTQSSGIIGYQQGAGSVGDVLVSGTDARWDMDGSLSVGFRGEGHLTIESQGVVASDQGYIGRFVESSGANLAFVDGVGSEWSIAADMSVGSDGLGSTGNGTLQVTGGGLVDVGTLLALGSGGVVDVTSAGQVTVGTASGVSGAVVIGSGGTLKGAGMIEGNVLLDGGTVSPGFSPGVLTIDGDFTQGPLGLLTLEVGGYGAGTQYDQLLVSGALTLHGTVNLTLIDGFVPQPGDHFDLFDVSGAFDDGGSVVNWLNLPTGLEFTTAFSDGVFSVDVIAVPEPATWLLLLLGVAALVSCRRRPQ